MDAERARRYREAVLAPGGARDAEAMADFLGRPVAFDAWEARLRGRDPRGCVVT